ncbi:MAG TPA: response regulator transcription factor [Phenylobacterium sp.]|jgi:two-component system KDP operon response regulator KdpE|uniref:response regulator transcription factor n=1 Tax=Phenylobacterium sp. TaxID=1871053 RepID=UPI002B84EDDE|nr:response regulator transcription factor [Phenylobacterium sp.]HXA39244.1 response regulator transcription factor [Phenylobacterium sp.]
MSAPADPATILVVEDDASLNAALAATLRAAGFRPVTARTAAEGLRWFAHYAPDLVLLDLGLPDRDGLSVISEIRARGQTPIVVLSAREAEAMKVEALDRGADDYVQKPFGVEELLARLRAGLRHGVQARGSAPVVRTGDLTIDLGLRQVVKGQAALKLSPKEYDLLAELALNLGRTVSHKELLAAVWGSERAEIQYLRVYVGQLRQKLGTFAGAPLLTSDPGVGYRLAAVAA